MFGQYSKLNHLGLIDKLNYVDNYRQNAYYFIKLREKRLGSGGAHL